MVSAGPPATLPAARLTVAPDALGGALVSHFIAALAANADLPVDRLQEACLIGEAFVSLCGPWAAGDEIHCVAVEQPGLLRLRMGPLVSGGSQRLLDADARSGTGGVLRALAADLAIHTTRSGEESLAAEVRAR